MAQPLRIIGSFVSPYVRKVLACLNLKGLAYEVDPITPFFGNDEFERLSPLRRIPVLIDGDFTISDSSVICAYLDEAYPGHPLLPADPKDRARARWLEEFADTRLGDLFIWGLFYQKVVRPLVWGEPGDEERDRQDARRGHSRARSIISKRELPGRRLPVRRDRRSPTSPSPASSATAPMPASRSMPARWPRTAGFVERTLAHPCIAALLPFEDVQRSADDQGPAPGAARRRRAADRGDAGRCASRARGMMRL